VATKKAVKGIIAKVKPHRHLNCFLAKLIDGDLNLSSLLAEGVQVKEIAIAQAAGLEGALFVKVPQESPPNWYSIIKDIAGADVPELKNRSVSAVLLINVGVRVIAFTFGYGRFLLDLSKFEEDFGIKTALNTLESKSLRSVDLFTLDGEALQKRTQAPRNASVTSFGIDVSKDILRAVTGTPKKSTGFTTVAGGEAMLSFGVRADIKDLAGHAVNLISYYDLGDYRDEFSWVDNVRRIRDPERLKNLDLELINALKIPNGDVSVVPPDVLSWERIDGFSFTRSKKEKRPTLETQAYREALEGIEVTLDVVKRDRLFIFDGVGLEESYSVYQCLYFEFDDGAESSAILFGGQWYEVDKSFNSQIERSLKTIPISKLSFDPIYSWVEGEKVKLESEGDYNARACVSGLYNLLDKQLIKSDRTTTPIEFCDLLTMDGKLIHVKHKKGRSAGLSHLFAQGAVSAEVLLGDREFRKKARVVLRRVNPALVELVPLDKVDSKNFEVVFVVLDEDSDDVRLALPFFSKVNLVRTYEGLNQRGFSVSIIGVGRTDKPGLTGSRSLS